MTTLLKEKQMTVQTVDVSPQVAKAWLDKNAHNRQVSKTSVESYARDMKSGAWLLTGDAIRFDEKGFLLDGQHRLLACIAADVPFKTLVAYGVPARAKDVIDSNKPRRPRDVLYLHGYHNTVILVTAARWFWAYKDGQERTNYGFTPSNSEVFACVKANKTLPASCNSVRGAVGPYPGLLAFIHCVAGAHLGVPAVADAFVDVFKTGLPSRDGCPAHKLREHFIKDRAAGETMKREPHFRALVHTWNVFNDGGKLPKVSAPKDVEIVGLDRSKLRTR